MVTWILVWVVSASGFDGYQGNSPVAVATGSAVFHSKTSCEVAAKQFKTGFCLEDRPTEITAPPVLPAAPSKP